MEIKFFLLIFTQLIIIVYTNDKKDEKNGQSGNMKEKQNAASVDNPNFVRDRSRNIINKPEMPPTWKGRYRPVYDPAWMDYCDPYHCNDYHKQVCGLNRRNMKFKWFQSMCHMILNNQCAVFRGFLKYDYVSRKFCQMYVMFLRAGCPRLNDCTDELDPVCAMSSVDGHVVLFKNQCFLDAINCKNSTLQEYEAVYMSSCENVLVSPRSKELSTLMHLI